MHSLPRFPKARVLVRVVPALLVAALLIPVALAVAGSGSGGRELLPDLDQEMPTQLIVTRGGTHDHPIWRIGFRSAVRNIGDGPLIIDGRRPEGGVKNMDAAQVIVRDGGPRELVHRVGHLRYVYAVDHQHWHLLGFDRYELRRAGRRRALVKDRKSGFCLGDRYPVTTRVLPAAAPKPVYTSRCGLDRPGLLGVREGISVGYGDDYVANLEGQYLRLNGLRAGRYVLVHRVNADHSLREVSYDNNAASDLLRLRWRNGVPRIEILAVCPTTARCARGR
jgi:Lysyl oxidase